MFPRRSEDQKSTPVNVSTYNTQRRDKEKKMKMRTTYPAAQHDKHKNDMTRSPRRTKKMQGSSRATKDDRLSIDRPKLSRNLTKCRTNGESSLTITSPARTKHLYYTKSGDAILWITTNSADLVERIAQPEAKYKIR